MTDNYAAYHEAEKVVAEATNRGSRHADSLADANFFLAHGMNRDEHAAMLRTRARDDFEARAVADLDGEPPSGLDCDVRGLSPARSRLAKYLAWRADARLKLTALEQKRAQLFGLVDAPAETETRIQELIRRTADFLRGRSSDDSDERQRKALDDHLAVQRHRADAAKSILPDIERDLEIAKLRVEHLERRESEFLNLAVIDIADAAGMGRLYQRKKAELRAIESVLDRLTENFAGYGARVPWFEGADDVVINWRYSWREIADAITANPRADVSKYLPKLPGGVT